MKKKALKYLKGQCLMALATSSPRGEPHCSAMLYVVDDDFNFYFVTKEKTRKAEHLAQNPEAALTVGFGSPMNIQARGMVRMIEDEVLQADLFAKLADAGSAVKDFWPPVLRIEAGQYLLYRMEPRWVRVLDLEDAKVNEAEAPFYEIIS